MAFGVMVIGDEMLVGKRPDKRLSFSIEALTKRGLRLAWPNTMATTRRG